MTFVQGTSDGQGGGGALDCADVSFDFDQPIAMCGKTGDVCSITGVLADGRALRETCTVLAAGNTGSCDLFVDDVKVCSCPSKLIDFANTCSNGVPTCREWKIDFSDISVCL